MDLNLGIKDVRTNCFYASVLRTQIQTPPHTSALSNKLNNDGAELAIAMALPEFNGLGCQ